jgi:hypothetical protein
VSNVNGVGAERENGQRDDDDESNTALCIHDPSDEERAFSIRMTDAEARDCKGSVKAVALDLHSFYNCPTPTL